MTEYELVVGLEVHAELSTQSKIYCTCKNEFGREVNSACCPVCMGMPGTLPVLNEKVVDYAVKMGHAMNCTINPICKQDRKNYFYPDLPKAYQISQFDIPLCENGYLDIMVDGKEKRIGVTRIHIEEDAGKLLHDDSFSGSLVDFNRCGVPLIEIVSEPDMRSSAEAKAYLETIKSYLIYLDISDAKMQEGSVRCDVNVSIRKKGNLEFGTRTEMKNVNTFSGAVRAIEYEYKRQIEVIESGGTIVQETRRWIDDKGKTVPMRSKEDAHDYRYFPEPDLKTIVLKQEYVDDIKSQIPELPNQKIKRFMQDYGMSQLDSTLIAENLERTKLFEETISADAKVNAKNVSNWVLGDVSKVINETGKSIFDTKLDPKRMAAMIVKIQDGTISNAAGKTVFQELMDTSKTVDEIIEEKGLAQISDDSALESVVDEILANNEKSVNDYRGGKTNALGFLVGQCMKATKGKGNPARMKEILLSKIEQ